ncbi:MAG: HAMP domain-containing protein [Actinomycetota bacterium]|nr:HAMP domain-containing protein [Actinomycetota bacterium]
MTEPQAASPLAGAGVATTGRTVFQRLRLSILGKILAALVIVLIVSTAVTAVVDARLTRSVVTGQTRQVASSNLRVLQEAFAERQRHLVSTMRSMALRLEDENLADPARRAQLIAKLGSEAADNQLGLLDVVTADGAALNPPVAVGRLTVRLPVGGTAAPFTVEPTSRLLATTEGRFVQAVPIPLRGGPRDLVLIGGIEFGDDLAYALRRQVGNLPEVILVVGRQLAGTTLRGARPAPPGLENEGSVPSDRPRVVSIDGTQSILAYAAVGRSAQDPVGGALGIALPDPAVAFDRQLAGRRVVAGTVLAVLAVALGWLLFRGLTQPLVNLARTAVHIARGDLEEPFVAQGNDEIGRLAGALERMRQELRAKLELVEQQAKELQVSSQRIVAAQDEERRRLARDLHDGIQQQLVMLRLRLGLAMDTPDAAVESDLLEQLERELDRTIESLREVSHNLYPAILRDRGLTAAVRSYAGRLPVPSTLSVLPEPLPPLPAEVESAAYFLISEAVTNIVKHADANEITMALTADDGYLTVRVDDDGKGFEGADRARRGGLLHMDDRVRSFGGMLRIQSAPGTGTSVVASFPIATNGGPGAEGAALTPSGAAGRTGPPPPGGSYPAPH